MQYKQITRRIGFTLVMLALIFVTVQSVITVIAQSETQPPCMPGDAECSEPLEPSPVSEVIVATTSAPATATDTATFTSTPLPTQTPTTPATFTSTAPPTLTPTATLTATWTTIPSATATHTPSHTPPPTATPLMIFPVTACWADHPTSSTSRWVIENQNPSPLRSNPETKLRFDWYVYVEGLENPVQSATNYDNPGELQLETRRGDWMVVRWHLDEQNQPPVFLGETIAYARPEDSCDSIRITQTAIASITPSATATNTALPTETLLPTETATETLTGTPTDEPTATETPDEPPTPVSETPTDEPTATETPTETFTPTPTPTNDSQIGPTNTPTMEPSPTTVPPEGCDVLVPSGMTEALAAEIETANQSGEATVICLEDDGDYPVNEQYGSISGLPSLLGNITLEGNNAMIRRGLGAPPFRLLHIGSGQANLRNLTLTNGFANAEQGGALLIEDAAVTLEAVQFVGNRAADGGGLFIDESAVTIIGGSLADNEATGSGGGLSIFDTVSSVGLFNVTISGNSAVNGGGVALASGTLVIEGSTISSNLATNGGSFYNVDLGSLTVEGSVITGNSASFAAAGLTQTSFTTVSASCLFDNQTTSGQDFTNAIAAADVEAMNNWWGAEDGPGGVADGSGTSISTGVVYIPFLTSAPSICSP